jgi:uncharacterized protein YcbK (DUF882 family)
MKNGWLVISAILVLLIIAALGYTYYLLIQAQGMRITSWFRTPWKNDEVGGVAGSLHLLGWAWDIVPVSGENERKLKDLGLKVVNEGDHLHAQLL